MLYRRHNGEQNQEESGYKDDHDRRHITDSEPEYDKR